MKKPFKIGQGTLACFDVDDTLVAWDLPNDLSPDKEVVSVHCNGHISHKQINVYNVTLLKQFAATGHKIIVWSRSGADWAEAVVKSLKLESYVDVICGKPTYYIDDDPNPQNILGKHGYFDINGNRKDQKVDHRGDAFEEN